MTASLPPEAARVCATWLSHVDALAPGLVTGLHVRGGIGFGEFVSGASDIDMVAVLARRPGDAEVAALEESHLLLAADEPVTPLDGVHLTADDLAADPDDCPDVPCVLHGWFDTAARFDLSPVAWHELAGHSIAVRGELPSVWTSADRLTAHTRTALQGEWASAAAALAKFPAEAASDAATWHVLGAARLLHVLVAGGQNSKSAAGRWALGQLDQRWHPVLHDALRLRGATAADRAIAPQYDDPAERGADVAEFVAHVVAQA